MERVTVAKQHEAMVGQLNASLSEMEKALGESRNALEEVRGDLEQERLALARATQQGKQWKQERDALQAEVQRLSDEVGACHTGIRRSQTDMDNFVESISQYLDKISLEFRRIHGHVCCVCVCVCVRARVCAGFYTHIHTTNTHTHTAHAGTQARRHAGTLIHTHTQQRATTLWNANAAYWRINSRSCCVGACSQTRRGDVKNSICSWTRRWSAGGG